MGRGFWADWRPGILAGEQIEKLFSNGVLLNGDNNDIDHAALDLHLSDQCWQTHGSVKLKRGELLANLLKQPNVTERRITLSRKQTLKTGKTYVVKLREEIGKSAKKLVLCGAATGKSTIGRLDVLTRLIVDGCEVYDFLPEVQKWPKRRNKLSMYVEITPITFRIKIKEGLSVNQLRFFRGKPDASLLSSDDTKQLFKAIIDSKLQDKRDLSLDLSEIDIGGEKACAFTSIAGRKFTPIDLTQRKEYHSPREYWKPIKCGKSDSLKIDQGRFYILRSKERFKLPPNVGVYCEAVTENLGELRIHYAGFVHPEFGSHRIDGRGAPLIFEVRGHSVPTFLRDGEIMARLEYYWMSTSAKDKNRSYNDQELQLSKYFKKWNA